MVARGRANLRPTCPPVNRLQGTRAFPASSRDADRCPGDEHLPDALQSRPALRGEHLQCSVRASFGREGRNAVALRPLLSTGQPPERAGPRGCPLGPFA